MKVATKSPPRRNRTIRNNGPSARTTLTLPAQAMVLLEQLRGTTPKSRFVEELLEKAAATMEKQRFYARATAAYTPAVCQETLALNKAYPIHDA